MDSMKNNGTDDFNATRQQESYLTLLKCGTPSSSIAITIPTAGTPSSTTLTSLTLNTSCFSNPCIKLEFASNIIFPNNQYDATLTFQVFKLCNNQTQAIAVGPAWVFARQIAVAIPEGSVALATKDTFSFFICDHNACASQGGTYTVVVTPSISTVAGTVTINNATLAAIVSGNRL